MNGLAVSWTPPGPGPWRVDASHAAPASPPIFRRHRELSMPAGMATVFERYGAPLKEMVPRFVNGRMYLQLVPLVGGVSDRPPPPKPVLWLAARLHPAFRRRTRAAASALATRRWRAELRDWQEGQRAEVIAANRALQDEPVADYDDDDLAAHVQRVFDRVVAGETLHFQLHGTDLGPIGDLLVGASEWGLDAREVLAALAGSSPASRAPMRELARLGELVATAPVPPRSLADVRALGAEAAGLLDAYLDEWGWRVVTSYDVEGQTLGELPEVVLAAIVVAGRAGTAGDGSGAAIALRTRVPEADRPRFDELMTEARSVYGLRDENGPLTVQWPIGLLRRGLLEAGRRLAATGRIAEEQHVFELDLPEVLALLRGAPGPSAAELATRAAERRALIALEAPATLGPPETAPPIGALPKPMAQVMRLVLAAVEALDAPDGGRPLEGTGIGCEAYTGRARVAHDAADVLATMEPGDVLVAPYTAPTYNAVLAVAGAVVVEEGGLLCHAAVMAREFGIPAVVGAAGALAAIKDGDTIEVDPVAGRVAVVTAT